MTSVPVKVKWGKNTYDVDLAVDETPSLLRAQLFALTGVEPDRQKIMIKGKTVKDEDSWSSYSIKTGAQLLMMGTVGELPQAPTTTTTFIEDIPHHQQQLSIYTPGLENHGNTCYFNATLQCLFSVTELGRAIIKQANGNSMNLTKSLGLLFSRMKEKVSPDVLNMALLIALGVLRRDNPRFAERHGDHFAQQDANECWSELFRALQSSLPALQHQPQDQQQQQQQPASFIDQFFGIKMNSTFQCAENPDEPPTSSEAIFHQLSCHIEKNVGLLMTGLKQNLEETIEKTSSSLGRTAIYNRKNEITRLPAYLVVNFVRFYYKKEAKINAKIRKDVKYPYELDVYELCSSSLQQRLQPQRLQHANYADQEALALASGKLVAPKKTEIVVQKEQKEIDYEPSHFPDDIGSNNSGLYVLSAVLTHKGSSSDSGHYVAWIKQQDDSWLLYDDDNVTPQKKEDILKLSGEAGADWHTAYILIYSSKKVPVKLQLDQ